MCLKKAILKNTNTTLNVTVIDAGQYKFAELKLLSYKSQKLSVNINFNLLQAKVIRKSLHDIDFTLDTPADLINNAEDFKDTTYPSAFCLPQIYNPGFFAGNNAGAYGDVLNNYYVSTQNPHVYIKNIVLLGNTNALVPQPFLLWILEKAMAEDGITIAGTFVDDPNVRKIFLYQNEEAKNNFEDGKGIVGKQIIDTALPDWFNFISATGFNFGANKYTTTKAGDYKIKVVVEIEEGATVDGTQISLQASSVINSRYLNFGGPLAAGIYEAEFEVNLSSGQDIFCRLKSSSPTGLITVVSGSMEVTFIPNKELNLYGNFVGFTDQGLPNVKVGDLLKFVKNRFSIYYSFDAANKILYINNKIELLNQQPQKINLIKNNLKKEFSKNTSVAILNKFPSSDKYLEENYIIDFQKKWHITKDGEELVPIDKELLNTDEISLDLAHLPYYQDGINRQICAIDEPGTSINYNIQNTPELRISIHDFNNNNTQFLEPVSLEDILGVYGLNYYTSVINNLKEWHSNKAKGQYYEIQFYLNTEQYKTFNIYQPIAAQDIILHMIEIKFQKVKDYYIATAKAIQF